jgi:hypothetical protein
MELILYAPLRSGDILNLRINAYDQLYRNQVDLSSETIYNLSKKNTYFSAIPDIPKKWFKQVQSHYYDNDLLFDWYKIDKSISQNTLNSL